MTAHGEHVAALAQRVDAILAPLLPPRSSCALLPYPNWGNPGDHAIWMGQLNWLRRAGHRVAWWTGHKAYDPESIRRAVGDGVIVLCGGGNFGDLYAREQELREHVLVDFPEAPIVQLPQSIQFDDEQALVRAAAVVDAHPNFTLTVRDERSFDIARQAFRCRVVLCPDMALALGPLEPVGATHHDVVWLARADAEASAGPPPVQRGVHRTDWIVDLSGEAAVESWAATTELSTRMVRLGLEVLSAGRVVVTDRLHGHILALLLGRPHVVLDNSYGKVGSFYRTWSLDSPLTRWADSVDEAAELAAGLLNRSG